MQVTHSGGRKITIRRRDPETKERIQEVIETYPYCFVPTAKLTDTFGLVRTEEGYEGVYGTKLTKVYFRNEYDRREWVRANHTWEGNISFANQVLNDRLKDNEPYPNYEHRIWYVDGEWKKGSEEVTVLSAYDSYTKQMYTWVQHPDVTPGYHSSLPCKNHPSGITEVTFPTKVKAFANERQLLADFAAHMKKQDPDILTGWYFVDADVSTISTRMRKIGLDPRKMSPLNQHNYKYGVTDKRWTQPIPGRTCIDLMIAFKKLWTIKNGQLASQKLDDVAEFVLGEKKLELPDGHDTYYTDIGTYVHYNRIDVELLPRLDEELNVINYYTSLQHLVQCDIETVPMTTAPATSLFIQDEEFEGRIPDDPRFAMVEYQGADIQEPEPGRYENMAIMDIKAMYHSNVKLHNISWDTLSENGKDCGNGSKFLQDKSGLLGRVMDKMTVKRNEYKALMKQATTDAEKRKWDAMQFATKSMVASLYGVSGDSKYGMYHPEIAAAITYTSRQTLFRLRDECNNRGYPVRYGHTDSIFCEVPTPEDGVKLVEQINESMAPIETEFEKWCESMILKAKNRYAGKVTWTDGGYHDPEYYYKGLELKQARMPKAMKEAMDGTLRGILDGKDREDIDEYLTGLINAGNSGELGESLLMKGKLRRPLHKYKSISGAIAGVVWAKDNLNRVYEVDESFLTAIGAGGQYYAFDSVEELEGVAKIDWPEMTERFIVNKACAIYDLVNWDTQPLWNAHRGIGNVKWL
jgi:DNA polymerase elongation subunit (family B)